MPREIERPQVGRKRSEAARIAILDAALSLLRERGYAALTCEGIAGAAGVGKQTIYRWWSNKADVVLEALTERARTIGVPATGSAAGDVQAFFSATTRLLRGAQGTGPVLKGLMAEAQLDAEFAPRFAAFIEARRAVLRSVLARHGNRDAEELDTLVDMLFGALWYRLLLGHAPLDAGFAVRLGLLSARALQSE